MIKKIVLLCIILLAFSSIGFAALSTADTLTPDSPLYPTALYLEEAQTGLTRSNMGKALLQLNFAERRINAMEAVLENGRPELLDELVAANRKHLENAQELTDMASDGPDFDKVVELVTQAHERRQERLQEILDYKDIPDAARAGIQKAMENQVKAFENFCETRCRVQERIQERSQVRTQEEPDSNEEELDDEDEDTDVNIPGDINTPNPGGGPPEDLPGKGHNSHPKGR
ncbi:MAG: hypothetical protein CVU88_05280 [Firmicutes bacterium HGW-Firmicutes-13]|nr:MAG: hypothetical protein CVU88_05280 [Firmicutes bacterium HGW-Firmicutes-13]